MKSPCRMHRARRSSCRARGAAAVLTVPGAVDSWFALHERFGSLDMERLLKPAIACARDGAPIARSLARSMEEERSVLDADEGAGSAYGSGRSQSRAVLF